VHVQRAELIQADSRRRVVCVCVRARTEERLEWLLLRHATMLQSVGSVCCSVLAVCCNKPNYK